LNKQPATEPTLASFLSPAQREVFNAVQDTAQREGVSVYLVGGAVRDWLMGWPVSDLDFVVEGNAVAFAQQVQQQHGGSVQAYEKFHTATWTSHNLHTDIVTARRETYARPAVLPDVTPASIEEDAWRRDFTINTIALRLSDAALLDPFHGQADLQRQLIRALHARSFIDDPTRMLRAAR
jgi:tRNA nucleotidyltransferase/poly(A) polymerase